MAILKYCSVCSVYEYFDLSLFYNVVLVGTSSDTPKLAHIFKLMNCCKISFLSLPSGLF